mgnify:CR=1 FL=1
MKVADPHSVNAIRYGEVSENLKKKAAEKSPLISFRDIEYIPFNANSSEKVNAELAYIKKVQDSPPEWYEGEYKKKLDKEFVNIFFDYAKENNLVFNEKEILDTVSQVDSIILKLKLFYNRPRPYQINQHHDIDIKIDDTETAQTPSYPSGHALQGRLIYKILAELNSDHEEQLKNISDRVSLARVMRGVHFPTDNEFSDLIVDKYIMPKLRKTVYLYEEKEEKTMNLKFKHKTSFENNIQASCFDGSCKRFQISKASLENLRTLIPEDVDLTKNIDLLGVAFNAAVVNKFNKNGDGIDTKTALAVSEYFVHKPTNIEHNKEKVVGHIVSSSFSDIDTSELLQADQIGDSSDPFNISLGALVYKIVNPDFAAMLEKTSSGDEFHNLISASWEIGFNDFYIAVGSNDLREAEIVTDKTQIKELQQYLRAYDGEGKMEDGTLVNRLVIGDIYPLGIGFTSNPAAEVEGVIVENQEKTLIKKDKARAEKFHVKNMDSYHKTKENENKISLLQKNNVNTDNKLTMDTKDLLKQIEGMLSEKIGDSQQFEEAVASVSKVMMDAIKEKDVQWSDEKAEKEKAISEATERHEALSQEVEGLKEKLIATELQWNELAEEKRLREAKDLFNSRMASVTEAFDLNEEDLKIVASEISDIENTEEAFASYQDKLTIMWSHKTKAHIEEQEKLFNEKLEAAVQKRVEGLSTSEASNEEVTEEVSEEATEEVTEEVLESVEEESSASISNNNEAASTQEASLRQKFTQAFSKENINIKY